MISSGPGVIFFVSCLNQLNMKFCPANKTQITNKTSAKSVLLNTVEHEKKILLINMKMLVVFSYYYQRMFLAQLSLA